jgi:hypothetical protein
MYKRYDFRIYQFVLLGLLGFLFNQSKVKCFFVEDKGVYVNLTEGTKRIKVPFKEREQFYFSIKNDTTALIQDIFDGKLKEIKEYKILQKSDTAYIKRYSFINGKRKVKVEKVVFRKVY